MSEETQVTETGVQDVAPENNPKEPENNPKAAEPATESEVTDSATPEVEDYSFDAEAEADGGEADGDTKGDEDASAEYSVEWPEGYEANEDLTSMVNTAAREVGVSDKALGAYTVRMIEQLEERQAAMLAADDAALKEAWGKDYLANKKAAKGFMQGVMKEHGISAEEARVFANPKGFKLLYALSQKLGGGSVHVGNAKADEKAWAASALKDRSHPDYKALSDPKDPRHKEVTARWFRAQGAKV